MQLDFIGKMSYPQGIEGRFIYHGQTANQWWAETDNHRFRLFWAPVTALPTIAYPQNHWLEVLVQNGIG